MNDASRPQATAPPLEARDLEKRFRSGDGSELQILRGVGLRLSAGEAVAVVGASGAGKSTLLHILGALDQPSGGEVLLGGRPVAGLDDEALAAIRNLHVGFVFQFHHLLREFTALENVMMPALVAGATMGAAREAARELLDAVGVRGRDGHKPRQLSGGEQQRVAVARALVNQPLVLLADEPSGNLDSQTSHRLHDLLFSLREERGLSMVIVTHNQDLAGRADRILRLEDGRLAEGTAG
ncbi:MAG TPA: ABC transporter ATP-binding protein [Longimicrobiales bacterium]|nr:ABC transporter ATP-binding protein [Longimicrobiales bacterium]